MGSRRVRWMRLAVHLSGLVPLVLLIWAYWSGQLGPDSIGEAMRRAGRLAILFLMLSLTPTVVTKVFGIKEVLRVRRALGLYTFLYAATHFLIFIGLDYGFDLGLILLAIRDSRFILVGAAALILLATLALTSTKGWMKRLGKNWKRLHRAAYVAAALAVWHYAWAFKELRMKPIAYGVVLAVLLTLRLPPLVRWLGGLRRAE